jgi:kynurenine formamidase
LITAEAIADWEISHGAIRDGEVVLLRTGWDQYYVEYPAGSRYSRDVFLRQVPGWPSPTPDAIELLNERGVKTLGTDGPSIGPAHDPNPSHWAGLRRGMNYIEGLANLSSLPERGGYFVFLPVKIAHSSGGPGRAFAYL